jgi:hypothetical protein
MCPLKGPRFFAFEGEEPDFRGPGDRKRVSRLITDIERYRALFAGVSDEKAIGEASAWHLYVPESAYRIRQYVPEAKLIAILRNPVDRAYSHFLYRLAQGGQGGEPFTDFARALDAEEERVRERWGPSFHYKRMGFYHEQLKRYYELFEPEQIRVYLYEDLDEDACGVMQDMFQFLGVNDTTVPEILRHNVSGIPKSRTLQKFIQKPNSLKAVTKPLLPAKLRRRMRIKLQNRNLTKPPMPEGVHEELTEAYREDILKLQELIGRDLSSWLKQ